MESNPARGEPIPPPLHSDGRICPSCGYDLRGSDQPRCPECGHAIDLATLQLSSIPWVHRATLGRVAAYRKTIAFARRRNRELAREVIRPVSLEDAESFRRATVAVAALPAMLALLVIVAVAFPDLLAQPMVHAAEWLLIIVGLIGIWLFFLTATGVASYWFNVSDRPIEQQWRGIALSYYAAAPLSWTPVVLLLALIGLATSFEAERLSSSGRFSFDLGAFAGIFFLIALIMLGMELAVAWWLVVKLLRRSMQCSIPRAVCCGIGLPLAWAALATLFLLALPAACYYLELIVVSLRR